LEGTMNARLKWFAILSVFAVLGIVMGSAAQDKNKQEPPKQGNDQPFKLSIMTNLVIVPVIVTDKHGDHVSGLTAEDFEVKEDGNIQKITRLDELAAESNKVEPPQAAAKTFTNQVVAEHPKKLEIIALDQVNTPFASARDGSRMLVEFLSRNVDANTLLALVTLEHNGVRIIHNFTSDPSVLVAAVKKVQAHLSSRDALSLDASGENSQADQEALQLNALLSGTSPDLTNVVGSNPGNVAVAAARASSAQARAQIDASRQAQEGLITLEDMQQIAQYFSGVPGRKSLIWASTGFPFAVGTAASSNTRGTLFDDWERTFRMLTDANIAVYPVDISGLLPGVNANNIQTLNSTAIRSGGPEGGVGARSGQLDAVNSGAFVDPNIGRQETMRQLADMTGGQAFYNSNDGAELFRRAGLDSAQYYLLAYYTRDTGKHGWRKLSVKVHRDNVKVRARSGFFFHSTTNEPETARQADEMMAMVSDLNFTSIPIKGQWQQIEPAGNDRKLRFLLSVPAGVPFVDTEHDNHINYDFRVVVMNSSSLAVAKLGQRLDTKLAPYDLGRIQSQGLDYTNELTLPPGDYKVHFVVRDNLTGRLGSVVTSLKVE
jgi:VWFA-related protein